VEGLGVKSGLSVAAGGHALSPRLGLDRRKIINPSPATTSTTVDGSGTMMLSKPVVSKADVFHAKYVGKLGRFVTAKSPPWLPKLNN
jgi:hypothetical protein